MARLVGWLWGLPARLMIIDSAAGKCENGTNTLRLLAAICRALSINYFIIYLARHRLPEAACTSRFPFGYLVARLICEIASSIAEKMSEASKRYPVILPFTHTHPKQQTSVKHIVACLIYISSSRAYPLV